MRKQSLLLLGSMLLATPATVQAQFKYTITTNHTVTITGYSGPSGDVIIPSTIDGLPVTSIGLSAFSDTSITSITISNSITSIGVSAFYQCSALTSVTMGNSVTSIGVSAFSLCTNLTSVTIPSSVTSIGGFAFSYCTSLSSVSIPNSVTSIGAGAFNGCSSLTDIKIPTNLTSIGYFAFDGCSLTSVTIPSSVISIGDYAFEYCTNLTSLYFQGNAPSVGGPNVFLADTATIYYFPGTMGWGSTFDGLPTAVWTLPHPVILNSTPAFGVQSNQFGFTISWATNLNVVVEAASDLANPIWSPVQTNALNNGVVNFTDAEWTNYPSRFYRVRSQ